mmetsp:Transcript_23657/g.54789  ORF Transcript_23657/g.54789 Transcript_23657/m.54789 type:complete len:211 (-) Transcript_23657:36-668(-)
MYALVARAIDGGVRPIDQRSPPSLLQHERAHVARRAAVGWLLEEARVGEPGVGGARQRVLGGHALYGTFRHRTLRHDRHAVAVAKVVERAVDRHAVAVPALRDDPMREARPARDAVLGLQARRAVEGTHRHEEEEEIAAGLLFDQCARMAARVFDRAAPRRVHLPTRGAHEDRRGPAVGAHAVLPPLLPRPALRSQALESWQPSMCVTCD